MHKILCCNEYNFHLFILFTHTKASCTDCTTITAASVAGTFIIAFILGALFGVIVHRSTLSKQRYSPKSSGDRNLPLGPVCAMVSMPTQQEAIELLETTDT